MCANDFRLSSHASHFCSLLAEAHAGLEHGGTLCHITPSGSGTRPSILLLNLFTSAPYRPVIGFGWILVVICPPLGKSWLRRHQDTGHARM